MRASAVAFSPQCANVTLTTHAEAIKYAVDTTLVEEDEITIRELVQLLAERVDEVDEEVIR